MSSRKLPEIAVDFFLVITMAPASGVSTRRSLIVEGHADPDLSGRGHPLPGIAR
jgi:hypothetical protein